MSELSIFIDESGDFGTQSSLYLLTFIFHNQSISITSQLKRLDETLNDMGWKSGGALHAGPMIRREEEYRNVSLEERRKLFDRLLTFTRTTGITYASFAVVKKAVAGQVKTKITAQSRSLSFSA